MMTNREESKRISPRESYLLEPILPGEAFQVPFGNTLGNRIRNQEIRNIEIQNVTKWGIKRRRGKTRWRDHVNKMNDNWPYKNRKKWKTSHAIWTASRTLVQELDINLIGKEIHWIKYKI